MNLDQIIEYIQKIFMINIKDINSVVLNKKIDVDQTNNSA
jgi:hypothetical protein